MPVGDRIRRNLHRTLESVLGEEEADTLMSRLPPVTWNDVATRAGLDALRTEFRGEFISLETSLRGEMNSMRAELCSEMQTGFATLRAEFVEASNRQIKWLVTFAAAWTSLLVAIVRLIP